MNMKEMYMEKAKELMEQGYTADDIDRIKEENFLTDDVAEALRDAIDAIEMGDEDV